MTLDSARKTACATKGRLQNATGLMGYPACAGAMEGLGTRIGKYSYAFQSAEECFAARGPGMPGP